MSEILGIDTDNYAVQSLKSTGGGSATLQSKSVTITDNGTQNVTPDTGYDGLSSVAITTNVSGGSSVVLPNEIKFQGSYATNMDWLAQVDTSNITNMYGMFQNSPSLISVPQFDTSNSTNCGNMFNGCTSLKTIGQLNTSKSTNFKTMCSNCIALEDFPIIDMSAITSQNGMQNMFSSTAALTNNSLNNILASLLTITVYLTATYKKLSYIGLSQAQATTCTTLSNWSALQAAGWTTGY